MVAVVTREKGMAIPYIWRPPTRRQPRLEFGPSPPDTAAKNAECPVAEPIGSPSLNPPKRI